MYLSRLILNPRSRQVRSELARPYEMHRTLLKAFPQGKVHVGRTADNAIGLLYRIDEDSRSGDLHLLVQSQQPPQWNFLATSDYLLQIVDNLAMREVDLQLHAWQVLAFRLRANPTRRLSAGKNSKGKRIGIYKEDDQESWLQRKGDQHGFRTLRVQISRNELQKQTAAVLDGRGVAHDLKMFSVQFDGVLQVVDADRFVQAIGSGIGSGKAFGFGLLSVARAG